MTAPLGNILAWQGRSPRIAGALVAPGKRVAAGEVWAGRPARRVRAVTDEDRRKMLDYIWPHYRDLGHGYRAAGYDLRDASGSRPDTADSGPAE